MSFLTEYIDNFKFNFLSRGQLESLNLNGIFFTFIQNITMLRGFFYFLPIFAIIARMLCGNHLNLCFAKLINSLNHFSRG